MYAHSDGNEVFSHVIGISSIMILLSFTWTWHPIIFFKLFHYINSTEIPQGSDLVHNQSRQHSHDFDVVRVVSISFN